MARSHRHPPPRPPPRKPRSSTLSGEMFSCAEFEPGCLEMHARCKGVIEGGGRDTATIDSLSSRGTSGERAGERGIHIEFLLSPTLSSIRWRRGRNQHTDRHFPLHARCGRALRQLPALTILAADELVRRARVVRAEFGRIPLQLLAGAIGHVAEVVRLR